MADTTYVDSTTLITADSMNDFNRLHYTIFGDPADVAAVVTALKASQAQQETGTSNSVVVTPGTQHFHQSANKAACQVLEDGAGNYTLQAGGYNVASILKTGTGMVTITLTTACSAVTKMYPVPACIQAGNFFITATPATTSTIAIDIRVTTTGVNIDCDFVMVMSGDL